MPAKQSSIRRAIEKLAKPVEVGADPALMAARLEEQRIAMLEEAKAQGSFDAATLSEVEAFLNDPRGWQAAHP